MIEEVSNRTSPATDLAVSDSTTIETNTMTPRDAQGRFLKKEIPDPSNVELIPPPSSSTKTLEETLQEDTSPAPLLPAQKKRKILPTKSPYFTPPLTPSKTKTLKLSIALPKKRTPSKLSEFFSLKTETDSPPPSQAPRSPGLVSCIPFPALSSPTFGLIQERLSHNPFRLLIAVTFLNRTHGKHAIPVFYSLMQKYPTPQSLVEAKKEDIVAVIQHLGLQNQRAKTYQDYARIFIGNPPVKGKRYAVKNYPSADDSSVSPVKVDKGDFIKKGEVLTDEDPRPGAWEIGHVTQGPYALDSWRIFCRDILRGVAIGWNGEGSTTTASTADINTNSNEDENEGKVFQPEWMRVLPKDKELRAFLRWMWLKEGFEWDPETGEKDVASPELLRAAAEGRMAWDEKGGLMVCEEVVEGLVGMAVLGQVGNLGDVEGELNL